MITCSSDKKHDILVEFAGEHDCGSDKYGKALQKIFKGEYLSQITYENNRGQMCVCVGIGKDTLTPNQILEVSAYAVGLMKEYKINEYDFDVRKFITMSGLGVLEQVVHGICLGNFEKYKSFHECVDSVSVTLTGVTAEDEEQARVFIGRGQTIGESVLFARELVNAPSNLLKIGRAHV